MALRWLTAQRTPLLGALHSALSGREQIGAVLVGPAGVGKTVLARTAVERFVSRHPDGAVHWVAGTASAINIPLGAFSHVVDVAGAGESAEVLRAARISLRPDRGSAVLVAVDDAHLLDDLSATLVHQLALTRSAQLVVTVRAGEPAPDAITALWKDDVLARIDVEPFTKAETTALVEEVLGGPLETASAERIFGVSRGNPLYLRHLVEGASDSGGLRRVESVWQWRGEPVLGARLSALIGRYLESLPDPVRTVLQYLAVREPLPLEVLSALAGREAVEQAETLNAVRVTGVGEDLVVHSAHPLYTEGVRQTLGGVVGRRLRTAVVGQLSTRGARHAGERLALAALALDSDHLQPVAEVVAGAYEALRLGDLVLGERLARGALQRSDDLGARVALAHALGWQGRGVEAEDVFASVDPASLAEWDATAWTLYRVANQFWMLRQPEQAMAILQGLRSRVSEPAALNSVDALAATFAMNAGAPRHAVALAGEVLASPCSPNLAVAWAAATTVLSNARMGRLGGIASFAERSLAAPHLGLLRFNTGFGEVTALLLAGDVVAAQQRARHYLDFAELQQPGHAIGEVLLARTLMTAGDFTTAVRLLRQAVATLSATGYHWGALALTYLAEALGQQGDHMASAEVLAVAQTRHGMDSQLFAPELALATAWTLAAKRDLPGAVEAARGAARIATDSGQDAVALCALHDAVRLGDGDAEPELARISARTDCVMGALALAHGSALRAGDATALDAASTMLAAVGMNAAAADASAQAATAYAAANQPARQLAARARAAELASGGAAWTPALERALSPLPLTNRQREVAAMVAAGLTNKSIADRLGVSVRTVEGHVYQACSKLGVDDRATLAEAVAAQNRAP